ncbi:MAG: hypothetical protein BWY09_01041 [Candidatus Hydrogenedentes bacterium ADurb.Bin179]|nr:MAG: hypothetical protein BWY09_01041 [Candidatus Hydrogenedentes bacterium ADurb.Bin179]
MSFCLLPIRELSEVMTPPVAPPTSFPLLPLIQVTAPASVMVPLSHLGETTTTLLLASLSAVTSPNPTESSALTPTRELAAETTPPVAPLERVPSCLIQVTAPALVAVPAAQEDVQVTKLPFPSAIARCPTASLA